MGAIPVDRSQTSELAAARLASFCSTMAYGVVKLPRETGHVQNTKRAKSCALPFTDKGSAAKYPANAPF